MVHKALHSQAPEYRSDMFCLRDPSQCTCRPNRKCKSENSRLILPNCSKDFAINTLRYTGSQLYRKLSDTITKATNIQQFKLLYRKD